MLPTILSELGIVLLLVLANGFFAGAEIAVVALRKSRIEELAGEGRGGAAALLAMRNAPERFLATVQVGITVVSATAAAFGGASIARELAPVLGRITWIGEHAEGVALGVVVALISYLSIVIGELVPKSLALRGAEQFGLLVARPLLALSWLAKPLVWFLSSSANTLLRPFGDSTTFTETRHSAEELQQLVEEATRAGTIHPEAGEIASRALDLPALSVADVMVPRQRVVGIDRRASRNELRRILLEHTHSRLPVYEGRIDNVVGYISAKDVLAVAWEAELIVLEDLIRPPYFVPESKAAVELLKEMRASHRPFAIVVDEQGSMSGLVTMEDLLEELVGEIFNEHSREQTPQLEQRSDGTAVVGGALPIRDLNRALGLELPEDAAWTTIAGLCLAEWGRIPGPGEAKRLPSGIWLEIVDATSRKIRTVRITRATPPALAAGEET